MKRSNIFMWAYISFIAVALFLRMLIDYPLWQSLIWGITISSAFFSVESLFNSLGQVAEDACNIANDAVTKARESIDRYRAFAERTEKLISEHNHEPLDMSDLSEHVAAIKSMVEEETVATDDLETTIAEKRRDQHSYQRTAKILAFCGFFSLLSMMIVASLYTFPSVVQEMLTVICFGCVLVTSQLDSIYAPKIKGLSTKVRHFLYSQEKRLKDVAKSEELLERFERSLLEYRPLEYA